MHRFEVWAPRPDRVELVLETGRVEMDRDDGGWWHVDVETAGPGTRYGSRSTAGRLAPIRARLSARRRGRAGRAWSTTARSSGVPIGWRGVPLPGAVLYELHVGTFTPEGTFDGAIERLPHLVDLGVDAIELLPVAEFPGDAGGATTGSTCPPRPTTPTAARTGCAPGRRVPRRTASAWSWTSCTTTSARRQPPRRVRAVLLRAPPHELGPAINLDGPGSDEVRRFFVDNALMWLRDYHLDGFRIDAVHALVDDSATHCSSSWPTRSTPSPPTGGRVGSSPRATATIRGTCAEPRRRRHRARRRVGRRVAPRAARRAHRGARRLLRGLRLVRPPGREGAAAGVGVRRHWSPHRQRPSRPLARRPGRPPVRGVGAEPRPDRQPGRRRPHRPRHRPRAGSGRRGAAAHQPVHPDAVPGRGVGREHAVPVLHRPPGPRARTGGERGAAPTSSATSAGTPSTCPTPGRGDVPRDLALDWSELDREPHAGSARLVPPVDRPPPRAAGARRPAARSASTCGSTAAIRCSGFDDDPASALQLGGEDVVGVPPQREVGSGQLRHRLRRRHLTTVTRVLGFLELLDEVGRLLRGELARRLPLAEPHRPPSVTEVGVPRRLQQLQQLLDLTPRCGRTRCLSECHAPVSPIAPVRTGSRATHVSDATPLVSPDQRIVDLMAHGSHQMRRRQDRVSATRDTETRRTPTLALRRSRYVRRDQRGTSAHVPDGGLAPAVTRRVDMRSPAWWWGGPQLASRWCRSASRITSDTATPSALTISGIATVAVRTAPPPASRVRSSGARQPAGTSGGFSSGSMQ
jgi:hypothetical protein